MVAVCGLDRAYYSDGPAVPMPRLFSATTPLLDCAYDAAPNPTRRVLFGAGHGREYDSHRGDYYHRYRIYIPEWGQFTGPDMQFEETEPEGACNCLFCANDPVRLDDPFGLLTPEDVRNCRSGRQVSWGVLGDLFSRLYQWTVGGSDGVQLIEQRRVRVLEHEPGRRGGMAGGVLETVTLRLVPVMETQPSTLSEGGAEFGASRVPLLDSAERLTTGETVTGQDTSRVAAGVELTLELVGTAVAANEWPDRADGSAGSTGGRTIR